jgi:hypothetical protein
MIEQPEFDLDLSNTDRHMLAELSRPGCPLWKIMRQMEAYQRGLERSLADVDFDDEKSRNAGRKVQATIQAIDWAIDTLVSASTPLINEESQS